MVQETATGLEKSLVLEGDVENFCFWKSSSGVENLK
jgi:hypothetical protein